MSGNERSEDLSLTSGQHGEQSILATTLAGVAGEFEHASLKRVQAGSPSSRMWLRDSSCTNSAFGISAASILPAENGTTSSCRACSTSVGTRTIGLLSLWAVGAWKQSAVAKIEAATAPVARIEVTAGARQPTAVGTDHALPRIETIAFLGRMTVTATRLQ